MNNTTSERAVLAFPFPVGRRVRFNAGPFAGLEGTVEKIKANGIMVVRGDPLHGRDGPGFSVDAHEGAEWDVVLASQPASASAPLSASAGAGTAETWFCGNCGGLDIRHNATVKWNPEKQDWDVEGVLDDTWCESCMSSSAGFESMGEPVFGIPGDPNATNSMIGGGA